VLASENWHVGVIGIAASRLVEKYYRPVILIALDKDGSGKGSGRSIEGFDLHGALEECKNHLIKFGGHKYAAGLSIQKEALADFKAAVNEIALRKLKDLPLVPVISPCAWLNLSDINPRLMRLLELMEPFGPGNPRPTFFSDALRLAGRPSIAGEKHLKFMAVQGGTAFDVIAFGMAHRMEELTGQANHFGLAFGLEENQWNGTSKIQLKVKGMRL
jgi:single-stranded-DNA-specific exonuclease